jgi:hypothetical protein
MWSRDWKKSHLETAPPGDPSHKQPSNLDTIVDAGKCLLMEAWYGCLLRGSARAWQTQRWMLPANHWTEHGGSQWRSWRRDRRSWGGLQPHRGSYSVKWPDPLNSWGLDHQPKCTHGGIHGSGHICGKGWPCFTLEGGAAFGPWGFNAPM